MKIAVLFDGAGLARLGLEQAGHECVGFELDPWKHYLSTMVGSGNCVLQDATTVDLRNFNGVWASPPCQKHSIARDSRPSSGYYAEDYLEWCLQLPHFPLWVENVLQGNRPFRTATVWNAGQFTPTPIQSRNRGVGGMYKIPHTYRPYQKSYEDTCPAVLASEWKQGYHAPRNAARFYGRKLSLDECAYHQGFTVPQDWYAVPDGFTEATWMYKLYEAIGNGVPVYMAKAFGEAHKED